MSTCSSSASGRLTTVDSPDRRVAAAKGTPFATPTIDTAGVAATHSIERGNASWQPDAQITLARTIARVRRIECGALTALAPTVVMPVARLIVGSLTSDSQDSFRVRRSPSHRVGTTRSHRVATTPGALTPRANLSLQVQLQPLMDLPADGTIRAREREVDPDVIAGALDSVRATTPYANDVA